MNIRFVEADCLKLYPFDGDFGDPSDRILEDKMVTARAGIFCCNCGGRTSPGTRVRVLKAIFDGKLRGYRWCSECCAAMAASWEDSGKSLCARTDLHRINSAPGAGEEEG